MNQEIFERGVEEIIEENHLINKLKEGKKLRIKFGIDPTAPDLHLGHTVALRKLKQFQDLGHQIVLIIGDFTATIGDPSARKEARKILSREEVDKNAKTYLDQIGKILDLKKTEVRKNSEWYDVKDTMFLFELATKVTLQHIMKRDDFQKRLKQEQDINMLETIYPLLQGYDSVCVEADLEIGGTDQKFNLLMGRKIQRAYKQPEQDIMTLCLLEGTDGVNKMSKSMANYIGITEDSVAMYGKIMSIPDGLIEKYFRVLTDVENKEIDIIRDELKHNERNPRDVKLILAEEIVKLYHGEKAAASAKEEFINVFSKKELPTDIPEVEMEDGSYELALLLVRLGATSSNSEAKRLIDQGAVRIDEAKVSNPKAIIGVRKGMIIQVGKRKVYRVK